MSTGLEGEGLGEVTRLARQREIDLVEPLEPLRRSSEKSAVFCQVVQFSSDEEGASASSSRF